jgi:hypothetical protein
MPGKEHAQHTGLIVVDDEPQVMAAMAKRASGLLDVQCPGCGHVNQFPEFDAVFIFLCHDGGEPIEVIEPVQ